MRGTRRAILLAAALAAGCGKEGAPLPPEPSGPFPPQRVAVRQLGPAVEIAVTVPKARGEKPSQRLSRIEVVRVAHPPGPVPPPDREAFRLRGTVVATLDGEAVRAEARVRTVDGTVAALAAEGAGWNLRYAVRVLDERGRPSILVAAEDLVPVRPPSPPGEVQAVVAPEGIRVTWTAGGSGRFNVYRSSDGGPPAEDPLNPSPIEGTTWLDGDAALGGRYVYHVRAVGEAGLPRRESASAVSQDVLAEDRFAPEPPTGLAAVQEGGAVRLFWNPSADRDLAGYRIARRIADGDWEPVGPDPAFETLYLDRDVAVGQRIAYRIVAVDRAGNAGGPSAEAEIDIVADPSIPSPAGDRP